MIDTVCTPDALKKVFDWMQAISWYWIKYATVQVNNRVKAAAHGQSGTMVFSNMTFKWAEKMGWSRGWLSWVLIGVEWRFG